MSRPEHKIGDQFSEGVGLEIEERAELSNKN
jgi:hypothetical protein